MHPLLAEEVFAILEHGPFSIESFPEGTVRIEMSRPCSLRDITIRSVAGLPFEQCYFICRENQPPLFGLDCPRSSPVALLLAQHRAARFDTTEELQSAVSLLLEFGKCTDNDAYIVDALGRWLLYVSHHDKIHLYEQTE